MTFDAEKCMELQVSEKMRYFEKQKTRTFAEFWEQREASKGNSGVKAKDKKKKKKEKGEEKEARRIAAEMKRI